MSKTGPKPRPMLDRLYAHIEPDTNGGCWLWSAALTPGGYGQMGVSPNWKLQPSHRVSYELHCGPIPDGLHVCHKCDVRACVNPAHLFLGTRRDNMQDMVAKGRANPFRGEQNKASRLTEADVLEIRRLRGEGLTFRALGRRFGIAHATAREACAGISWAHLQQAA